MANRTVDVMTNENDDKSRDCPDIEVVISFALDPVKESHAEIAGHIYGCDACQKELLLANESILLDQAVSLGKVSEAGSAHLESYKLKAERWRKLEEKLSAFVESFRIAMRSAEAGLADVSDSLSGLFPVGGGQAAAFAVSPSERPGSGYIPDFEGCISIVFAADCPAADPRYWRAELTIPPGATPETTLVVSVTDQRKNSVRAGRFVLVGVELPIVEGIAEITLADFQKNLKTPVVELRASDGTVINGNLELF